jgi:glycosyltransferase involved in cell wall biosynthesis
VAEPHVSVVVATHNRPARLARLLASLRAQSISTPEFEVIVVDDGSEPATHAVIEAELELGELELRRLRQPRPRGPAAARNAGWRIARAPLIAFTDDDCAADRDWLRAALAVAGEFPGTIIQGRTEPDPAEIGSAGLYSRTMRVQRLGPRYETCNIFYGRDVLQSMGGFDESFGPRPTAEDTDLAWRAIEAGCATAFAPAAVVFHAVQPLGVRGTLGVATRWTGAMRLFAAHPQGRRMLYRGRFWNVWHYLLWRSLLALAAPAWLRRWVLARHLRELSVRAREQGAGPAAIPFLLVYDAVECWAVVRGAVRHRTLVL